MRVDGGHTCTVSHTNVVECNVVKAQGDLHVIWLEPGFIVYL
jgi:hypothetical protein